MICDLHRHFSGSISCETLSKISGVSLEEVINSTTYQNNETGTYEDFFKKFNLVNEIKWDLHKLDLAIQDCVWSIKKEDIDYAEIKFSIEKYLKILNVSPKDIIIFMAYKFEKYASELGLDIDLILCLKHEMDKNLQELISNTIKCEEIQECISGIDVVGNENYFNVDFYKPIFDLWDSLNKSCMLHVGETYNPKNVYDAVDKLKIDRICHGIAVANDKDFAKIANDSNLYFDVCPTSNIYTGVAKIEEHPVKMMIENGFVFSIGTDDPIILNTNITKEYDLFKKICELNDEEILIIKSIAFELSSRKIIERKSNKI